MNLDGMRAVVIDDKPEEVENLFLALNKKGISYNYYRNIQDLPLNPQKGVRLVFLDFNLNAGEDVDPKTKESLIENFIFKIIDRDNGPYILIIWAASIDNDEILKLLKKRMPKNNIPLPVSIINDFHKIEIKDNADQIIKKIEDKIKLDKIVNVLLQWEKYGHLALNETLKDFIIKNESKIPLDEFLVNVDKGIKNNFYNLCIAEFGKDNIKKDFSIIRTPQFLLNEFFKENSDKQILNDKDYTNLLVEEIYQENKDYTFLEKAKMNTFFHLDFNKNGLFCPGSFYSIKLSKNEVAPIKYNLNLNSDGLSEHFKHLEINALKNNLFDSFLDCEDTKKAVILKQQLINECTPILFEISPECDYAQNKLKSAKFILGLIVPETMPIKKKAYHLYQSSHLFIEGKVYYLVMHSDYLVNIKLSKIKEKEKLFVARKSFFTHIQHWFSRYTSRPGKIEFN